MMTVGASDSLLITFAIVIAKYVEVCKIEMNWIELNVLLVISVEAFETAPKVSFYVFLF